MQAKAARRKRALDGGHAEEVAEAEWGWRPASRVAGVGRQEAWPKYLGNLRKYLAAYLRLQGENRDLDRLQAAVQYLQSPKCTEAFGVAMQDLARYCPLALYMAVSR